MSQSTASSRNPFVDGNSTDEEDDDEGDTPTIPAHPPTAGALGLMRPPRYPTPKPLGLPLTPLPSGGGGGHGLASTPGAPNTTGAGGKQQRRPDDDDDDDGPHEEGRWWTDWLCGCREGPDRGGDQQVCASYTPVIPGT